MQICNHSRTEIMARRDGVDYVRCLDCDQVFEAEDPETMPVYDELETVPVSDEEDTAST